MNKLQEELAELMPPAGIEEMSGEEIVGALRWICTGLNLPRFGNKFQNCL